MPTCHATLAASAPTTAPPGDPSPRRSPQARPPPSSTSVPLSSPSTSPASRPQPTAAPALPPLPPSAGSVVSSKATNSHPMGVLQQPQQQSHRIRPRPLLRAWFDAAAAADDAATNDTSVFDTTYDRVKAVASTIEGRAHELVAELDRRIAAARPLGAVPSRPPASVGGKEEEPSRRRTTLTAENESVRTSSSMAIAEESTTATVAAGMEESNASVDTDVALERQRFTHTIHRLSSSVLTTPDGTPVVVRRHSSHHRSSEQELLGIIDGLSRDKRVLEDHAERLTSALESLVAALLAADAAPLRTHPQPATPTAIPTPSAAAVAVFGFSSESLGENPMPTATTNVVFDAQSPPATFGTAPSFGVSTSRMNVNNRSFATAKSAVVRAALAGLRNAVSPPFGASITATPSALLAQGTPFAMRATPQGLTAADLCRTALALFSQDGAISHDAARGGVAGVEDDDPALFPMLPASGACDGHADMFGDSHASIRSLAHAVAARTTVHANVTDTFDDGTQELNQFVLLQLLGAGSQGEVFLALDSDKNEMRAIKCVRRQPPVRAVANRSTGDTPTHGALAAARHRKRKMLEREVAVMKRCRHRNVVSLYEVIDDPAVDTIYLVMQYVEHGPLRSVGPGGVVTDPINPVKLAGYARQICAGLEYLHRRGVIHRDIKPENILLGHDDQVYLSDFGVADLLEGTSDAEQVGGISGTRGTMPFLAPELFVVDDAQGNAHDTRETRTPTNNASSSSSSVRGESVDVWAFGVTLYVLLYGRLPWHYGSLRELVGAITTAPIEFPPLPGRSDTTAHQPLPAPGSVTDPTDNADDDTTTKIDSTTTNPISRKRSNATSSGSPGLRSDRSNDSSPTVFNSGAGFSDRPSLTLDASDVGIGRFAEDTDLSEPWRALLEGMLHRDPAKRLTVSQIRARAMQMLRAAALRADADEFAAPDNDAAITRVVVRR